MNANKQDILEALNPADSFTLAMDEEIRKEGLPGSYGCVALELNQTPDIEILQQRVNAFSQSFPVALASLQQIGRRFYWCKRPAPPTLFFYHQCPPHVNSAIFQQQKIDQVINYNEARESITPIEFHLICSSDKNTFFIRWIHPFCDARGADLIIKYLCTENSEKRQKFGQPKTAPLVNIQLAKYHWWQKIALLIKGKLYIDKLDRLQSIQPFDCDTQANKSNQLRQRLNYLIKKLTKEETERVVTLAKQAVGLTGTSLYYIGCLMRALDKLNSASAGEAYCVPYAFNLRKQKAITPVTGNHVCALFAQAPKNIVKNRSQLFKHLKTQNTQVIRQQQDYAFLPLMWAGSWLSLAEYGKTLRLSYGTKKERSSFWFSDIGRMDILENSFPGANIKGIYHICQVSNLPGLAFLSGIYQNRLTLSYNFIEPGITTEQIEKLHHLMMAELLCQNS